MIDGADLELFRRSLRSATERTTGTALDAALDELGWPDALGADPRLAVATFFPLQGQANAISSALQLVMASGLGLGPEVAPSLILPPLGASAPPARMHDGRLTVRGIATGALAGTDTLLVAAAADDRPGAVLLVSVALTELDLRPIAGMDPALGLLEVTSDTVAPLSGSRTAGGWPATVALAQQAVGHELTGAARAMLLLAREHAMERVQFGQPIGRFQAIRHRLADTLVAIESAEAVLDAAWELPSPELSAMAKALAGRGARTAARHCQQVLAGIGFTAEHPFHRHLRRVLVLDQLFGSARSVTEQLGRDVLAARRLPALLPL